MNDQDQQQTAASNSEADVRGVTRLSVGDLVDTNSGILATAINPATGGPPAKLSDSSIVRADGMEMRADIAARLGYVDRDKDGNYTEKASTQPQQDAVTQDVTEHGSDEPVLFAPEEEQAHAEFASQIDPTVQSAIMEQIITASRDGTEFNMEQAAAASAMSGEKMTQGLPAMIMSFQKQADDAISSLGVDPQEFYTHAWAHQPAALADAMRSHGYGRNPRAYDALVREFKGASAGNPQALAERGYPMKTENGVDMVKVQGVWTSVSAAKRAKLL